MNQKLIKSCCLCLAFVVSVCCNVFICDTFAVEEVANVEDSPAENKNKSKQSEANKKALESSSKQSKEDKNKKEDVAKKKNSNDTDNAIKNVEGAKVEKNKNIEANETENKNREEKNIKKSSTVNKNDSVQKKSDSEIQNVEEAKSDNQAETTENQIAPAEEPSEEDNKFNLPELSNDEVNRSSEVILDLPERNSKHNIMLTILSWILIFSGILLIIKVIIDNLKMSKNPKLNSINKCNSSKRGNRYTFKYK